jgi:hypothetical protein
MKKGTLTQEQYEIIWAIVTGCITRIGELIQESDDEELRDGFKAALLDMTTNLDDFVLKAHE